MWIKSGDRSEVRPGVTTPYSICYGRYFVTRISLHHGIQTGLRFATFSHFSFEHNLTPGAGVSLVQDILHVICLLSKTKMHRLHDADSVGNCEIIFQFGWLRRVEICQLVSYTGRFGGLASGILAV